jgi:hypothetical protein
VFVSKLTPATTLSWKTTAGLFSFFLTLYTVFRTNQYTAVDGALRCLSVFWNRHLFFDENNHLLYPVWVLLWTGLVERIGLSLSNAFEFIRMTQAFNALMAAAAIALLYSILEALTTYRIAVLCSLVFGFSAAVVRHATNSAEPMPGLFFCLLGIRLLISGLGRDRWAHLLIGGLCFAVAMASYQAMGTIAGVGAFMCIWSATVTHKPNEAFRAGALGLTWIALGGLLGVIAIYGFAYSYQQVPPHEMVGHFLSLTEAHVYGGLSISRILNVPMGFIRNSLGGLPGDYAGIRSSLLQHPMRSIWIPFVMLELAMLSLTVALVAKALLRIGRGSTRILGAVAGGACLLIAFPLIYWDPLYDKLWLLPLAVAAAMAAISLRPDVLPPGRRQLLGALILCLLIAQLGINVPTMVESHADATPHLSDAEDLSKRVGTGDWVVLDFDDVSALWFAFWGHDKNVLLLPASTITQAKEWLSSSKQECANGKARIFFVGVLDQDRKTWDAFLGERVGIPYSLFDEYRTHARVLTRYPFEKSVVTLREYQDCR